LPSEKGYSSAADIAADPDIDLVVVGVKVPLHKELVLPALMAGKDVFVEWPLANGAAEARELVNAAKEGGCRTIVGLQARCSPVILKVCEMLLFYDYRSAEFNQAKVIIESGALGKILSTDILGVHRRMVYFPPAYDYCRDANNGTHSYRLLDLSFSN
jgi:predicted dehydrogenase